jgi:GT2 family glycosyltransferase
MTPAKTPAMDASPGRVAIVLVNWNGWRDCVECLSALYGSDALSVADVWLVDNDSRDGSVDHIVQWCAEPRAEAGWRVLEGVRHFASSTARAIACRVWDANGQPAPTVETPCLTIVRSGGNLGFAGGNNAGIVAAGLHRYSHFWLLNTDTVIRHDALQQLLQRARADAGLGIVGSSLIYYSQPERLQALGGSRLIEDGLRALHIGEGSRVSDLPDSAPAIAAIEAQMAYVVGASMLVTAGFIRDIGLMCEDYFLYFEEPDWAYRARGRYRMGYAPRSWVFHKVGGSSAKPHGEFSLNLLYRNQLRFAGRFLPERVGQVQRKLFVELLRELLKGHWMPVRLLLGALRDRHELARAPSAGPTAAASGSNGR